MAEKRYILDGKDYTDWLALHGDQWFLPDGIINPWFDEIRDQNNQPATITPTQPVQSENKSKSPLYIALAIVICAAIYFFTK